MSSVSVFPLDGRVQHYAWGARDALPGFLGRQPDGQPWAEWWLGAHPQAPSTVGSVPATTLDRLVGRDPSLMLGRQVCRRFGARLPFLLKVLAVDAPLSLQVHPSSEQAVSGFRSERRHGEPPPVDPLYTDEWAKPEMLLAITRFDAFAGLRPPAGGLARLDALGGRLIASFADEMRRDTSLASLRRVLERLLRLGDRERVQAVDEVRAGVERLRTEGAPESGELAVTAQLAERYPDDPGVVVSVLMNHVVLEPGEAMAVPAGLLHCYTSGLAVEIQSTSNNTLRAGLTPKRVDVDEVLHVLDTESEPALVRPSEPAPGLETFHAGVDDFALDRICLRGTSTFILGAGTPAIILAMDGALSLECNGARTELRRGESVFVPAAVGPVQIAGMGEAVRARPGLPEGGG